MSVTKGQIAQLKTELVALTKGFVVSVPTVPARYDLIIDTDEGLKRVQVKYTACESPQAKAFRVTVNSKRNVYTREEIDYMAVYIEPLDVVCWLPRSVWEGKRTISLYYGDSPYPRSSRIEDFLW